MKNNVQIISKLKDNQEESLAKPMIELRNLTKVFEKQTALNNVNLMIEEGDAFGFIGPNGAGKTTTIRILSTLLDPTGGEAFINGISVLDEPEEVRKIIGYMPDYFGVYDGMKVWEYLDFFAAAYRQPENRRKQLISDVLELTDLTIKRETFIETLSMGMRQRLGVAKTLLNDPKVLILDEPASGLDPRARIELKELLKELTKMGKTIFISSHILPELADICNKIGIIESGSLLAFGTIDDFKENINAAKIRKIHVRSLDDTDKIFKALSNYSSVTGLEVHNGTVVIDFSGGLEEMSGLLEYLVNNKIRIIEFLEKSANLEDIFMKITKGEIS